MGRRERLSMLSPYKKHLNISSSQPSLQHSFISCSEAANSLSPTISTQSCSLTSSILLRQQNKTKRKKNMHNMQNQKKSKKQKSKKIESENAKLKKRLSQIRASNYFNNIQKHWTLHSHIRSNMQKYKKTAHCPDIIYSNAYYRKKKAMQKSS